LELGCFTLDSLLPICYNASIMGGLITKIECEQNRDYIVDTWGIDFYRACLLAEGKTFLSLLVEFGKI